MGSNRSRLPNPNLAQADLVAMSSDESTDYDVDQNGRQRVASVSLAHVENSSSDDDVNDEGIFSAFLRNLMHPSLSNHTGMMEEDDDDDSSFDIPTSHRNIEKPGDEHCQAVSFLPNKRRIVAKHRTKTFCCQYTKHGDVLMTASQDHMIRFYKRDGHTLRLMKEVTARDVGWAILDLDVSPDGRHVIYGTWSDNLHQFNVYGDDIGFESFNLEASDYRYDRFCAFSVRFSESGREIVAGASDGYLYVYDREAKKNIARIMAHKDDVNAVCFGDASSNIIYSGGDDGLCKVWDRRTLRSDDDPQPAGVLAGHSDGLTFIDSKGDGRYLISNSKDQSIKLWDIRHFSSQPAIKATYQAVSNQTWDYRWQTVPKKVCKYRKLEGDSSVMTYRGHTVLHTLVRSYFSPVSTTGQRYIYSGCAKGKAVIYDVLTGEVVSLLEGHTSCVRDVTWHPYEPEIVTSSWDGTTVVWRYDERRKRCTHPNSDVIGYEDTSDEEGDKLTSMQIRKRQTQSNLTDKHKHKTHLSSLFTGFQHDFH